jgi:hypothetical protein
MACAPIRDSRICCAAQGSRPEALGDPRWPNLLTSRRGADPDPWRAAHEQDESFVDRDPILFRRAGVGDGRLHFEDAAS